MAGTAGKKTRIKVSSTSGGAYTVVAGVDSASHSVDGANVDVSEMGVDWIQRIQGLKDGKLSLSGNLAPTDTNGQLFIRTQFLADAQIFVQVLPDNGTTVGAGFQQEMKVSAWKVDATLAGKVAWSAELEGTGAITTI